MWSERKNELSRQMGPRVALGAAGEINDDNDNEAAASAANHTNSSKLFRTKKKL